MNHIDPNKALFFSPFFIAYFALCTYKFFKSNHSRKKKKMRPDQDTRHDMTTRRKNEKTLT